MNYGQRNCLNCNQPFQAQYAAHVVCSPECKYERRKESWRGTARRQAEKRKAYVAGLEARVQELETQLDAALRDKAGLQVELDALKAELAALKLAGMAQAQAMPEPAPKPESLPKPKPEPKPEPALPLHECKRMSLRAMRLPCGERDECTFPTLCEMLAGKGEAKKCKVCGKWFEPTHHTQKKCRECREARL